MDNQAFVERMRFEVREFAQQWMIPSLEMRQMDDPSMMAHVLSAHLRAMVAEREYGDGETFVVYPTWWDHLKGDLSKRWKRLRWLKFQAVTRRERRVQLRMCPHISSPNQDHLMWMSYRDRVGNPDPRGG